MLHGMHGIRFLKTSTIRISIKGICEEKISNHATEKSKRISYAPELYQVICFG